MVIRKVKASIARSPVDTPMVECTSASGMPINAPALMNHGTGMKWEWALHVRTRCRYTHPRSPEGPERGVTPSAILACPPSEDGVPQVM